ncbi:hypothetical protein D3C78_1251720 [compost metagenome]
MQLGECPIGNLVIEFINGKIQLTGTCHYPVFELMLQSVEVGLCRFALADIDNNRDKMMGLTIGQTIKRHGKLNPNP